ncbi:transposase family protein [Streptomyces sp. I8-5]|uniref:transposase family protein n=1 Tax=Streptomyces sp. I8-5 TaxID=3104277 RepID=UPI00386BE8EA
MVRVEARSTTAEAVCPSCGCSSSRIHSSYLRFPADVPSAGRRVVLCLRVRRFFCSDAACGRRTFVEQMPGLTRNRWAGRSRAARCAVAPRRRARSCNAGKSSPCAPHTTSSPFMWATTSVSSTVFTRRQITSVSGSEVRGRPSCLSSGMVSGAGLNVVIEANGAVL